MMNQKHVSTVLLISWMALIFYFSAQPSNVSASLSGGITKSLLSQIGEWLPFVHQKDWQFWHTLVRKNAHFMAYMVLGWLAFYKLKTLDVKHAKGFSLLICILYAMTDEFHQLFVMGRSCEMRDVLIDASGATLGLILITVYEKLRN